MNALELVGGGAAKNHAYYPPLTVPQKWTLLGHPQVGH